MKNLITLLTLSLLLIACNSNQKEAQEQGGHEHRTTDSDKQLVVKAKSPKSAAMATIGENHIHVDYSAPSDRGRVIYGGLVAHGVVWSTGAHKATSVEFQQAVLINNTTIPAGKYGFFTIPGEEKWTLILSKDWDMHLADEYSQQNDVIRFEVSPEKLNDLVEVLKYTVKEQGSGRAEFSMSWSDRRISFDISNVE
jgi:hypothetical protein